MTITEDQFMTAVAVTAADPESRTMSAARRVLVDGLTAYAAAQDEGISPAAVYRAVNRLQSVLDAGCCPCCGQPL